MLEGLSKCISGKKEDTTLDGKAKAKIILSLESSLYDRVRERKTVKEDWKTRKDFYENKGFRRKMCLLRHLISLRLKNRSSMEEYINQIIKTSQNLGRTGLKLDSLLVGSLILAGLTDRFSPMVMALEHSGISKYLQSIWYQCYDRFGEVEITGYEAGSAVVGTGIWTQALVFICRAEKIG